jgi:hypothetical protein
MGMNTKSGTDATVKISTTTILAMASWSFTDEREALKAPVFGDSFNKVHGMSTRNISGSIEGFLATDDTTGQDVLVTAYEAGTTASGFRLYIDDTIYYHADGTDDNDGVFITSYNVSAAQNEIVIK